MTSLIITVTISTIVGLAVGLSLAKLYNHGIEVTLRNNRESHEKRGLDD